MNENADKLLDDLSRKVIGKSSVESTSVNFTSNVMSHIKAYSKSKATTYVPLISKRIWTLIGLGFSAIVVYVIFKSPDNSSSWLKTWSLDSIQLTNLEFGNLLPNPEVSQITMYAIVLLALMLCIQIPLLKHYFNKRMI
jgi:hypothetical protein